MQKYVIGLVISLLAFNVHSASGKLDLDSPKRLNSKAKNTSVFAPFRKIPRKTLPQNNNTLCGLVVDGVCKRRSRNGSIYIDNLNIQREGTQNRKSSNQSGLIVIQ